MGIGDNASVRQAAHKRAAGVAPPRCPPHAEAGETIDHEDQLKRVKTMRIAECNSYHAQTVGQNLLKMPDGKSVFKVYYLSVIGRDRPEQYEWRHSPFTPADFEETFLGGRHEGIGFVIAFPHVAKIFRFSPYKETILDVSEFHTQDMRLRDLSRGDGSHEFACYAEAEIAAAEYGAWARAETIEDYLAFRCGQVDFPVVSHMKLMAYWEQA